MMSKARNMVEWLQWDGERLQPLQDDGAEPETHVQEFLLPDAAPEVARICAIAPDVESNRTAPANSSVRFDIVYPPYITLDYLFL